MTELRLITGFIAAIALSLGGCGESHTTTDGGPDGGGADGGGRDSGGGTDGGGGDGGGTDSGVADSGGGSDGGGGSCSECGPGERCCPGCGDDVICSPVDLMCPEVDCPPPPLCGDEVCEGTAECCPGCDGEQFCAEGGFGCPDIDCPPPDLCAPMDARGEGACRLLLGWVYDGASCSSIGGCDCVGTHCHRLYGSEAECLRATSGCPSVVRACGTRGGVRCSGSEFCDFPDGTRCGAADEGGICRPRPEACLDIYDPVCGCDGMTYGNACTAHSSGMDVMFDGECRMSTDPDPGT